MNAIQAVAVIGVSLVVIAVITALMIRMSRAERQRIERRREAWQAEGGVGPCPDAYLPGQYSTFVAGIDSVGS